MSTGSDKLAALDHQPPAVLETKELTVALLDPVDAAFHTVVSADVALRPGRVLGVIGASGGGKSTLALALAGLIPPSSRISAASWRVLGEQRWPTADGDWVSGRYFRQRLTAPTRRRIYYVSQHARSSLIPNRTIAWHLEVARRQRRTHSIDGEQDPLETPRELLSRFFPGRQSRVDRILQKYPRQLSTGECQRAQFAMAMLLGPPVLIADEPFASVDPQTARVLVEDARKYVDRGGTLVLVTHQLELLRRFSDIGTGLVIHRGEIVQQTSLKGLLDGDELSPETARLFRMANCQFSESVPSNKVEPSSAPALRVRGLAKRVGGRSLFADQSFQIASGARAGIYGKSGGGKTTLARILVGLADFDDGQIERFDDPSFHGRLSHRPLRELWKRVQLTYQDTDLVFDPNEAVGDSIVRGIRQSTSGLSNLQAWSAANDLFHMFGMPPELLRAPPMRLSGGERKRAAIAKSLALLGFPSAERPPKILLLDEPTVGVDVFHQGVIAAALIEAQQKLDLTIVIFSHDHGFLARFCDRLIGWPIQSSTEKVSG